MKIAYFDCSSGIAGNMVLGALLDAGLDPVYLKNELKKILVTHYSLLVTKTRRGTLNGTYFDVKLRGHDHHRNLRDILKIINKSKLSKGVKRLSSGIFKRLAQAEAKVHGVSMNKVHFHEVGAVDAIIDIVGACIGLEKLGIEQVFCSPIPHGKGTIKHAHGVLPVPAPATAELLKGVPTYGADVNGEMVTPTGAAIITTIASGFVDMPRMKLEASGRGAGSKTFPNMTNFLQVYIGEALVPAETDAVVQIEANIDDMAPKAYSRTIAKLMKTGALDAYITPVLMKKERQGVTLTVLCRPEDRDRTITQIFKLTTTFGLRVYLVPREKLARKFKKVKTKYGQAKIKIGSLGKQLMTIAPEFENYKRLAGKHRIPIKRTYKEILKCL